LKLEENLTKSVRCRQLHTSHFSLKNTANARQSLEDVTPKSRYHIPLDRYPRHV